MSVQFVKIDGGSDVLVRGRRVPLLEGYQHPGGKITLVFDRRFGLELTAENYERVTAFIADVIENCFHPDIGRTFNRIHEITAAEGEDHG